MTPEDAQAWAEAKERLFAAMDADASDDDLYDEADLARMAGLPLAEFARLRKLDPSFPRSIDEPLQ